MNKIIMLMLAPVLVLSMCSTALALEITDVSITRHIVNRAPTDSLNTVTGAVGKLYCYTRVVDGEAGGGITHVWYYADREVARVRLPVRSADWRTWSSKRIVPQWKGNWRVEVLNAAGKTILIVPFSIL